MFKFPLDPEKLSPLVLAYLGDAVYELYVRSYLVSRGPGRVNALHRDAIKMVRAGSQAKVLHQLEGRLTPEEKGIMKRGRNAKSGHVPRHTEVIDYRLSTGLESLIGFLYAKGDYARLEEILSLVPKLFEAEANEEDPLVDPDR
jgi:ribonuclease-3 family protein